MATDSFRQLLQHDLPALLKEAPRGKRLDQSLKRGKFEGLVHDVEMVQEPASDEPEAAVRALLHVSGSLRIFALEADIGLMMEIGSLSPDHLLPLLQQLGALARKPVVSQELRDIEETLGRSRRELQPCAEVRYQWSRLNQDLEKARSSLDDTPHWAPEYFFPLWKDIEDRLNESDSALNRDAALRGHLQTASSAVFERDWPKARGELRRLHLSCTVQLAKANQSLSQHLEDLAEILDLFGKREQ